MTRQPSPDFSRQDAIYFLAVAGGLAAEQTGRDYRAASSAVCTALEALGVSQAELRVTGVMGQLQQPSHWNQLPEQTTTKEPRNDTAAN